MQPSGAERQERRTRPLLQTPVDPFRVGDGNEPDALGARRKPDRSAAR